MSKSENYIKALLKISRNVSGIAVDDMTKAELNIAKALTEIQFLRKVDNNGIEEYTTVMNTMAD